MESLDIPVMNLPVVRLEWNGVEWSRVEWSGWMDVEWSENGNEILLPDGARCKFIVHVHYSSIHPFIHSSRIFL